MTNEEKQITRFLGNGNHFGVPEGYFEQLEAQVMAQLPETEKRVLSMASPQRWWQRRWLRQAAAVAAVMLVVGGGVALSWRGNGAQAGQGGAYGEQVAHAHVLKSVTVHGEDSVLDQMADYTMMDNQDIYASLVAEY